MKRSGYKIFIAILGLPLLFGLALYNSVKSAQLYDPPPKAALGAQSTLPEPAGGAAPAAATAQPAQTTAAPSASTAQPAASQTVSPSPAAPAHSTAEGPAALQSPPLVQTPASSPAQAAATPDPLLWKQWPVIPTVSDSLRAVYQKGLEQGNNPHAFSILGDCQSLPEVFMGVFDENPAAAADLPVPWQETVAYFQGSFSRYSPTVKDGTTEGALLWGQWNDNKEKKCQPGESPIDCELRVHRPVIVFVHVGTHWEARNRRYLEIILNKILDHGAVPVLVTKADNRELDERVNQNYAALAAEYGVPLWNFWLSVQNLPNHGLEPDSDMYLSQAGLEVHRMGALQVLDAVWRAVR